MQYRLISTLPSDEKWLEDLRRSVYQELFRATWGGWDEARHQRHCSKCISRGQISIIEVEGVQVGMVQLFDEAESVEVGEIQIRPEHQNRGLATQVLTDIVAEAHRRGKPVRLSVGLKNDKAFRLYERLGFRRIAQSETHNHMVCHPDINL